MIKTPVRKGIWNGQWPILDVRGTVRLHVHREEEADQIVAALNARWIPVTERLPENKEASYIITNGKTWQEEQWTQDCNGYWGWWYSEYNETTTHWKPIVLPEAALGEKGQE